MLSVDISLQNIRSQITCTVTQGYPNVFGGMVSHYGLEIVAVIMGSLWVFVNVWMIFLGLQCFAVLKVEMENGPDYPEHVFRGPFYQPQPQIPRQPNNHKHRLCELRSKPVEPSSPAPWKTVQEFYDYTDTKHKVRHSVSYEEALRERHENNLLLCASLFS